MQEIKKGDAVTRNSYGNDIIFIVKRILKLTSKKEIAILKGINVRVEADAPLEDLKLVSKEELKKCEQELEQKIKTRIQIGKVTKDNRTKEVIYTGKILHLDGDASLQKCNYMSADIL